MRYDPIASLVTVLSRANTGPLSVIIAPSIARPCGSVMVPLTIDVTWAARRVWPAGKTRKSRNMINQRLGWAFRQRFGDRTPLSSAITMASGPHSLQVAKLLAGTGAGRSREI